MRWSSTLKSGIFVLLLSQHDPDDLIEILKNEFLGCGQKDRQVQVAPFIKTSYLKLFVAEYQSRYKQANFE